MRNSYVKESPDAEQASRALCQTSSGPQESKTPDPHTYLAAVICPVLSTRPCSLYYLFPAPEGSDHFLWWPGKLLGMAGDLDPGNCLEGPTWRFRNLWAKC